MKISKISSTQNIINPKVFGFFSTFLKEGRLQWRFQGDWNVKEIPTGATFSRKAIGFVNAASITSSVPAYQVSIVIESPSSTSWDYENAKVSLDFNVGVSKTFHTLGHVAVWNFTRAQDKIDTELSKVMQEIIGITLEMPLAEKKKDAAKFRAKTRLTRRHIPSTSEDARAIEIEIDPIDDGYDVFYQITHLETGKQDAPLLISNKNEDGSELTSDQAKAVMNQYIELAKSQRYVDENSLEYIPPDANADNWDFNMNYWKEKRSFEEQESQVPDDLRDLIANDTMIKKLAQNFEGYFAGDVPDYATQFLGSSSVEASQISSMFGKANEAINMVNRFDPSLLLNISFIFNFAKGGAYGVYLSELDRAIKTKALGKKLEQQGYEIKMDGDGLTAFPKKDNGKSPEQIQQDIDRLYADLQSKGGTAIGVNMGAVLSAAKQDAVETQSPDPDAWQWIAILHLGGTIVHEAIHAKGNQSEGPSEQSESAFVQWALPQVNEMYRKSMEGQGKGDQFNPLVITGRQRHARSNGWYKTADIMPAWYTEEVAKNTKDPKILTDILQRGGKDDWVSYYAASNPNCPTEALKEVLQRGKNDFVSCYAAENPHCPPEALKEVLQRGKDDYVSQYAAQNPNCPPEALKEVLQRGNNDYVSLYAARNPNCPPRAVFEWMRATGKITKFDPKKHVREKVVVVEEQVEQEDPDIKKIEDLLAENKFNLKKYSKNWYKTAQMSYYIPQAHREKPIGSDLSGRFPDGAVYDEDMAPWSMMAQQDQNVPLERRLGRQYMSPLPNGLSQEHDIIEEQLRKYTKQDKKLDPKATIEELLSEGWDKDRGYTTLEGLLDEKRPKPLMVTLKKAGNNNNIKRAEKLTKVATLFGWMNNLSISDGNTIPGLGDRVMAWDDRDEDFSQDEEWIKQQPRYNPTYDLKGFYYRWIEPRFQPQLFEDMTEDYGNTHPAKRFAGSSIHVDPDVSKVLSILSVAKSKIVKKEIKCTRFIATQDVIPIIEKVFPDEAFRFQVFHCGEVGEEEIFSIWICSRDIQEDIIERIEKRLQKKSEDNDVSQLVEDLFGFSKAEEEAIKSIVDQTNDVCKDCGIEGVSCSSRQSPNVLFAGGHYNQIVKIGGIVAERLGVRRTHIKNNHLSFAYKNINVDFREK